MNKKVNPKAVLKSPVLKGTSNAIISKNDFEKYFYFFEYSPIPFWIQDFSSAKLYLDNIAKNNKCDVKAYVKENPEILLKVRELVELKNVNLAAVKLYKAKNKKDLIQNQQQSFTEHSNVSFSKLVKDLLLGITETEIETLNYNFNGELINIRIKFKVAQGSEESLENVVVSVEDISQVIKSRNQLIENENIYKNSQSIAKIGSWFYNYDNQELNWSDELYNFINLEPNDYEIDVNFYLDYVHQDDKEIIGDFSTETLIKNPNQTLNYRIITSEGEEKYIQENRSVLIKNQRIIKIIGICQDITETVLSKQKLNATTNLFHNAISSVQEGFIILDKNSNYKFVNISAAEILGKEVDYLIGKNIWDEFPEKKGDLFYDNYYKCLKQKEPITFENYFEPWDKWFENKITPFEDGVLMLFHDITDQKINENKIKAAYNIINKSSSVAILARNERDFPIEFASDNIVDLFGYSYLDFLTGKVKMHEMAHPEDLNHIRSAVFSLIKDSNKDSFKPEPYRIITKEGQTKWIQSSLDVIKNSEGAITHIQSIAEDISERVKKEKLEEVVYNISKSAILIDNFKEFNLLVKNELHKVLDTSNFYIAMYNKETDIITTPVFVDQTEEIEEFPAKNTLTGYLIKKNKSLLINSKEYNVLIEKGEVKLIGNEMAVWLGVPLIIKDEVIGAIVVQSYTNESAYDQCDLFLLEYVATEISTIIQQKKADSDLQTALIRAQESDRLKSSFLANMSHEIRTPMNGIIGFSELFLRPNLTEKERKKYAEVIINSSKQLLSIVNDILDISKIEAGAIVLNYEKVNINDLLDDLKTFYNSTAIENNLKLKCHKSLPYMESNVEIDKTKLHQVLTNLLSNAFKFTDFGSIEFGYVLKGKYLEFFIKDSGIGIEKKWQSKIFERFTQVNHELNEKHKGTGLGLSISKRFIELFKGKIWLESDKNGSTVYFTIPYIKTQKKKNISSQKSLLDIKDHEITILVVEDEEYNMLYINELFSRTKFKLLEAYNGKEAVESAIKNPDIDLILMDIKMPIMNGNEAMKKIKKRNPNIPIIALSAFAIESDKGVTIDEGFDYYLTKPLDKNQLFTIIGTIMKESFIKK